MVDLAFPTDTSDIATPTRAMRIFGDQGGPGDISIEQILKLMELGDLPKGQVAGDRFRWSGTSWEIVRAILTGNLPAAATLVDGTIVGVYQGAADGSEVKTTLADVYGYVLKRLLVQPTVVEDVPSTVQDYTFQAADNNKIKRFMSATAVIARVPAQLPVGFNVGWIQKGVGQITFQSVVAAAQTIESGAGLKSAARYARGSLLQEVANTWNLAGLTVA